MSDGEAGAQRGGAATEQIPREAWERFLDQFTEFNAEMPVRIEVVASSQDTAETGTGILADNQPLLDVTLDDEAGVPLILIECGDPAAVSGEGAPETLRHEIREPTALWARRSEPAGWDALEIEGRDGSVILSLRTQDASGSLEHDAKQELIRSGLRANAL